MADYNLGTARGQVIIDYDGKGTTKANTDLEGLRKKGDASGKALGRAGLIMAAAGAAIAVGIGVAVKSAVSFESRLSAIKAVSGATGAQMDQVRNKALQLGKDTKFSAGEAAQAIEELSKAGITLPDILNGAADATVSLAAAGEIDLPRAATISANAMNQFVLTAKQLPHVADLLAGAANASAVDVTSLGDSLNYVGPVAHAAGVSIDDTITAIALLGNAGIKGSSAGTALRSILTQLTPTTKIAKKEFKALGLITADGGNKFFDAAGKVKPLNQVVGILHDSMKGLTKQQQITFAKKAFGLEDLAAVSVLAGSTSGQFDKLAGAISKTSAADVAKTRMDNLSGSVEQLKGSLETAGIVLGTILLPAIRGIVDGITGLLNSFLQLSPSAQSAALNIAGAAAAFLIVGGTALKLIEIMRAVRLAFITTWASALGPVVIIIAIIAALAAAVFILYQRFQPVRTVVDAVGNALRSAFLAVLPTLQLIIAGVQAFITALQGGAVSGNGFIGFMIKLGVIIRTVVIPAIIAIGVFLLQTFGPIVSQVISIVAGFVNGIIGYFRSILPQLTTIFNAIVAVIRFTFGLLAPIVIPIIKFVFLIVIQTLQLLAIGIRVLLAGIANIFRGVFNIIGGIVKVFLSLLTGNWRGAWNGIKQIVVGVLQVIKGVIQAVVGGVIVAICVSSLRVIGSVFRTGFAAIRSVVTGSINGVRAVISGGMAAARAVVSGALGAIRAIFSGNLGALAGIARGAVNALVGAFRAGLAAARGVVSGGVSGIVGAIRGLAGQMFSAGANIISSLASGITSRIGAAVSAVKSVVGAVTKFIPHSPVEKGPLRVLNRGYAGGQIVKMLADGITGNRGSAVRAIASVVGGVNSELSALAKTQSLGLSATVGVSSALVGASGRLSSGTGSAATSGTSGGRTVVYDVDVHNPPPVSGEKQVTDALRRIETLYSPFQGVLVG